jgi:alpha-D-ribose 1-methylphosphonate 5-triphosphate synthase subunit PhnH
VPLNTPSDPGFADPVRQAQAAFRNCLMALSRPGLPRDLHNELPSIGPMLPGAAELLLTLVDFEATVWLDSPASACPDITAYLRFHTGAFFSPLPGEADFALITDPAGMPPLGDFKQGVPDYPDRSTTLIVQVGSFERAGWMFTGPGIDGQIPFRPQPLPADFPDRFAANRQGFPCGVDILFVTEKQIAGLPRSASITETGGR